MDWLKRHQISIPQGEVVLFPQLFSCDEADYFLQDLMDHVEWKQERIKLYGKEHDVPRLTAWYGDPGKKYSYSGITVEAIPWTPTLLIIRDKITAASGDSGDTFNSVLLNFYRNGSDSVSWHSDDEPELGKTPTVSFGQERLFQLKHKHNPLLKQSILLPHGSLLIMKGETQTHWLHQIPKSKKALQARINLTFRTVRDEA